MFERTSKMSGDKTYFTKALKSKTIKEDNNLENMVMKVRRD